MINRNKILVIAEAGVNHNGSLANALKMVDVAAKAGADFIKFQTFDPESLANVNLGLANYQRETLKQNDHLKMLKKLTLSEENFKKILLRCRRKKINFLSSPFDIKSIDLLKKLKIKEFKIPSGQIDDIPYLEHRIFKKNISFYWYVKSFRYKKALNILIKSGTPKKILKYYIVFHNIQL